MLYNKQAPGNLSILYQTASGDVDGMAMALICFHACLWTCVDKNSQAYHLFPLGTMKQIHNQPHQVLLLTTFLQGLSKLTHSRLLQDQPTTYQALPVQHPQSPMQRQQKRHPHQGHTAIAAFVMFILLLAFQPPGDYHHSGAKHVLLVTLISDSSLSGLMMTYRLNATQE